MTDAGWLHALADRLAERVEHDDSWLARVRAIADTTAGVRVHIAVMREPYLTLVLQGRKKVESRFSRVRVTPYQRVSRGDIVLLKQVAGPIVALTEVQYADFYVLDRATWDQIRGRFADALCVSDEEFWNERRDARYATLMRLGAVYTISPLAIDKSDRRGWVTLDVREDAHHPYGQLSLVRPDIQQGTADQCSVERPSVDIDLASTCSGQLSFNWSS